MLFFGWVFLKFVGVFVSFLGASAGARSRKRRMGGKGGKGLIAAKTAAGMDKEKKQPVTRSSRAGLQVAPFSPPPLCFSFRSSLCLARLVLGVGLGPVCSLLFVLLLGAHGVDGVVVV